MIQVSLQVLRVHSFTFFRNTEQPDRVSHQLSLDLLVQGAVRREAGTVIDLEQVWLALGVQHDIEAQDLEAHGVLKVIDLARVHSVRDDWLSGYQGLDDDVLDLLHEFLGVLTLTLLEVLQGEFETSFVPHRVNDSSSVLLELV